MRAAVELKMDRSTLYRALDPMGRDEWVRIRAGTNARSRAAVITSKGYRGRRKVEGVGKGQTRGSKGSRPEGGPLVRGGGGRGGGAVEEETGDRQPGKIWPDRKADTEKETSWPQFKL